MTDREKQILEITRDLSDCLEYDIEDSSIVDSYDTACNLVNKGWVKIPEGAVVLTKEEYERFQRIENTIKHISTVSPTEAENENKALKETIAIVLAQKRNIWNSYNQLKEELDYKVNQAGKQAIKEFTTKLENSLDSVDVILHEDNDEEYVSLNGVLSLIDQVTKEMRVK